MDESIAEFMDRRRREIARFGRDAENAARNAYGAAIRGGQNLALRTPSEVAAFGAKLLQAPQNQSSTSGTKKPTTSQGTVAPKSHWLREAALQADTAVRSAANVMTFGRADNLEAGVDALIQPGGFAGFNKRYQANLAQEQARNRYDGIHRPVGQAAGQIGGTLLGAGLIGPMEGELALAPRLRGAAALTGREAAAILAAGGATGSGIQLLSDTVHGRHSFSDNLGATVGGVAGAAALPLGPARAGAVGAAVTSAAQDVFNRRPISIERAGESAITGNLLGGSLGIVGRNRANALPQPLKGPRGETLGGVRSAINGLPREEGAKARDYIEGSNGKYWYPDGVSGSVRFEDKFGVDADLSENQKLARKVLGSNFRLYHFLPADIGKAAALPAGALASQATNADGRE